MKKIIIMSLIILGLFQSSSIADIVMHERFLLESGNVIYSDYNRSDEIPEEFKGRDITIKHNEIGHGIGGGLKRSPSIEYLFFGTIQWIAMIGFIVCSIMLIIKAITKSKGLKRIIIYDVIFIAIFLICCIVFSYN